MSISQVTNRLRNRLLGRQIKPVSHRRRSYRALGVNSHSKRMPTATLASAAGGAAAFELLRNCESILLADTAGERKCRDTNLPFWKTNKQNLCVCCFKLAYKVMGFNMSFPFILCSLIFLIPSPVHLSFSYLGPLPPYPFCTYVKPHIFCHLLLLLKVSLSPTMVQFPAL